MRRLLLPLPVAAALAACSGAQSIQLVLDSNVLVADGQTIVPIGANVLFRGESLPDGSTVTFTASQACLFDTAADAAPPVPGARAEGATNISALSSGGQVGVVLLAPTTATPIDVTVSYTTINGDALTATQHIVPRPPPLVAAGLPATSSCSSAVTQDEISFDMTCARANIGAFVSVRPEIDVSCTLTLRGADGKSLPHTPLRFLTEAGALVDVPASATQARSFTYVVASPPSSLPRDVSPMPDEVTQQLVARDSTGYIPNAVEQNPRDGLVTLLVVARGQEAFQDVDGNGVYDIGEPFCDEGEPFLDIDDDGVFSSGIDVACCDNNGNGQVDGPNGVWDSNVWIGRMTHILWSGGLEPHRSGLVPQASKSTDVPAQGAATFQFWAVDGNFNPLASASDSDGITFDLTPTQVSLGILPTTFVATTDTSGMVLIDRYPYFRFGAGGQPFKRLALAADTPPGQRNWALSLNDTRQSRDDGLCQQYVWNLTATVSTTPAPNGGTQNYAQISAPVSATGHLLAGKQSCSDVQTY